MGVVWLWALPPQHKNKNNADLPFVVGTHERMYTRLG